MKPDEKILKQAVDAVEESAHISIDRRKIASCKPDTGVDFVLTYKTPTGVHNTLLIEVRPTLTAPDIGQLSLLKERNDAPLALVTEYVSVEFAQKLKEFGIQFFDHAGNVFLQDKNFHVFVTGNKAKVTKKRKLGVFRPAGIKAILAFCTMPGLENADYRTIEAETGVAKSSIGRVMKDLEENGYLFKRGEERHLQNKAELIERWVQYFSEKYREKLNPIRYHSTKKEGRWWNDVDIKTYDAFWGSETAGEKLTNHLRPQMATIYSESKLPRLQAEYGLVKDERGEVEILRKFWKFSDKSDVAPPLVVYADLLATADERNIETAKIVYDKYLAEIAETDPR